MIKLLKKYGWIVPTGIASILVLLGLNVHSYELDEVFSVYTTSNYGLMLNTMWTSEAYMWLYYLLLYAWQWLGTSEGVVRSLSGIFAILTIPVIYKVAEHSFGTSVAKISSLLASVNMFFVYNAQNARSYSMLLFFSTLSWYLYLRFKEGSRIRAMYFIALVLSLHSHLLAIFMILPQAGLALWQKKYTKFCYAFLATFLALVPVFVAPAFGSAITDWLDRPNLSNLVGTALVLTGDFLPLAGIYSILFSLLCLKIWKNKFRETKKYLLYFLWLVVPIITAFVFSWTIKPVFQSVYFLYSLPPLVILAALGVGTLKSRILRYLVLMIIFVLSLLRLGLWYTKNDYKLIFNNNPEDWRALSAYVVNNTQGGDAVIFFGYYSKLPYSFYTKRRGGRMVEISTSSYSFGGGTSLPEPNVALIKSFKHPRVWMVERNVDTIFFDSSEKREKVIDALKENYSFLVQRNFPELTASLYIKK